MSHSKNTFKNSHFVLSVRKVSTCSSFEIQHWTQKGPIQQDSLKSMIQDKVALFCLLTDKIDKTVLDAANNLKVIGMPESNQKDLSNNGQWTIMDKFL